jgi:Peptidase family M1 domain
MKRFLLPVFFVMPFVAVCQPGYWQQKIKYVMDIDLDVSTNIIKGKQQISYTNNSPDTLRKLFVHLFWNAFQPGSMMDVGLQYSENITLGTSVKGDRVTDFDRRFKKKIYDMTPEETGWCHVTSFSVNGQQQKIKEYETVLMVELSKPMLPKTTVQIQTVFNSRVPKLSRRSGRDSDEGIRYSMGQWYPKVVEYDKLGWAADDYVSREFYGVWGDYDVKISLDKTYKVGATGELQNAAAIGWGYDKEGTVLKETAASKRTWRFVGKNIHDFVWSADPGYKHITRKVSNGPLLHFIYKDDPAIDSLWQTTADTCALVFPYLSKTFGRYPYPVYSILHGGGGGTEYPMATLMRNGNLETAIHEICHSWYQMMLATNENLYAWMDEGFANYAEAKALAWMRNRDFFEGISEYDSYARLVRSPFDEPMSTHANFFTTNFVYNTNSYTKGKLFLLQLGYITGEKALEKIMLEYYKRWAFKHPDADDFVKVAESVSGMQLQWYKQYMVNTIKTVDYKIDSLWEEGGETKVRLRNAGEMPMPIDLQVTYKDSSKAMYYIPLNLTYGSKKRENEKMAFTEQDVWGWLQPVYTLSVKGKLTDISKLEIDASGRMADMNRKNNILELKW